MGLDFTKAAPQPAPAAAPTTDAMPTVTAAPVQQETELSVVEKYDIVADREQMTTELVNSPEVDALVSTIELDNLDSIVTFGAEAADEIAKASDQVLNSMNMTQIDETSQLMQVLANIMSKFDVDEIKDDPSFFKKIFNNARKQLDKILAKYHTMGDEVDKIYVQLRKYEDEIKQSNRKLNTMFDANVNFYHDLVKYILAGEQGCRELEAYIAQ